MIVKIFGFSIAAGVIFTSLAMILMGGKWQSVEQAGYAGEKRPWWFIVLSVLVIGFYIVTLFSFINGTKTIAGWIMVIIIPVGWAVKMALVTFNPKGRQVVSSISGDKAWIKIGLSRLPIAVIFILLALYS